MILGIYVTRVASMHCPCSIDIKQTITCIEIQIYVHVLTSDDGTGYMYIGFVWMNLVDIDKSNYVTNL